MRWISRVWFGFAAAAVLAVGAPTGATASVGGGLSYPAPDIRPLPDNSATGDGVTDGFVSCPAGFPHPVGGGVRIDGSDPGLDLELHASNPTATGWHGAANNNAGVTAQMTTFAVCAKGTYLYPSKTVNIPTGGSNFAKVSCPAGSQAIGGGAQVIGGDHADEVRASEPADGNDADHGIGDAWFGAAGNGGTDPLKLKVTAICDGSSASYKIKVHAPVLLTTSTKNSSTVLCPAGTRVVGGGADVSGSSTRMEVHQMFPVDGSDADSIPDDGFRATGYNDGDAGTRQLITFAICKFV